MNSLSEVRTTVWVSSWWCLISGSICLQCTLIVALGSIVGLVWILVGSECTSIGLDGAGLWLRVSACIGGSSRSYRTVNCWTKTFSSQGVCALCDQIVVGCIIGWRADTEAGVSWRWVHAMRWACWCSNSIWCNSDNISTAKMPNKKRIVS